jgi:hypothetical protein
MRPAQKAAQAPQLHVIAHTMSKQNAQEKLESAIFEATRPINGQLPRPWMTELRDPLKATVFIVGRNQRNGYESARLSHQRHIDALFNRNGESCRKIYDEITGGTPSPTRNNTDNFRAMLMVQGVTDVLETNVICYSTPMSADLSLSEHAGGALRGSEIFRLIFELIKPKVLIAHGAGTRRNLEKLLGVILPEAQTHPGLPVSVAVGSTQVFVIPSLAPPQWNKWQSWAPEHLRAVAESVARVL